MLKRLRFRLILLVVLLLFVISAGIVLAINLMNERQISLDAYGTLNLLSRDEGRRPDSFLNNTRRMRNRNERSELQADLGNYAVMILNEDGSILSSVSIREDLYTEEELAELTERILAQNKAQGQIERQYYMIRDLPNNTRQLIVLDNRLAGENARQFLITTIIVAACAWLLLSIGATMLILRMIKPVEEAFVKQRQFVSDASHELKTPLAVISANAQALVRENGHNEQADYILSEVGRADTLVKNLLSLARLEQATPQAGFAPFNLSEAIESVVLPFESTVYEAGRTLETEIPGQVTYIGQEEMIKQLVVILLSNALKYSDDHGVIRLKLETRGNKRILTVFNTGEGIAPENRERVFDRFWREDSAHGSDIPGQGLGLAIAKSIVDLHKGHITAGGEWHRNAVFTVTL